MKLFNKDDIVYEDEEILVCIKHAGIAVQSARSDQMDLESALKNYLVAQYGDEKGIPYLGVIHRLDQPVEGVLVFAKTHQAAEELNRQMSKGEIEKFYLAAVETDQQVSSGKLEDYLLRDGRANVSKVVTKGSKSGKRAILQYQCISQDGKRVILKIQLLTGRHHQIRVQLAHAGMPIIGDQKYHLSGQKQQLCLCAYKLVLYHPKKHVKLEFEIPSENPMLKDEISND